MAVQIEILEDADELAWAASGVVAEAMAAAVAHRGRASLVLSGGTTPRQTYQRLAQSGLDWRRVELYQGDERCVDPEDPASNAAMIRRTLLEPVGMRFDRLCRIRGELGPSAAARDYERQLRDRFEDVQPVFDLVLLGVGADGHTASIFPDSSLDTGEAWVVPTRSPEPPRDRVSLTSSTLSGARRTVFLVGGAGKAEILERLLGADPEELPASKVARAAKDAVWLLDRAAASRLGG